MLRPISPSPPSAITRRPPSGSGGGACRSRCGWVTLRRSQLDAARGEVDAQLRDLLGRRVDQRRPHRPGRQAEQRAAPP